MGEWVMRSGQVRNERGAGRSRKSEKEITREGESEGCRQSDKERVERMGGKKTGKKKREKRSKALNALN
jgi:hypothetical protein